MFKNFIKNFLNLIFPVEKNFLETINKKKLNRLSYSKNPMIKSHLTGGASLTFSSGLEKNKKDVEKYVRRLAKKNIKNLKNLLNYAKKQGAKFYLIKNAKKALYPIKEEPGLIFPVGGFRLFYLNFIVLKKFSLNRTPVFVLDKNNISDYTVLYGFYKWCAYRASLPGFDKESLSKFKNIEQFNNYDNLDRLQYGDIMGLKQAIARDREAMEFVISFMGEVEAGREISQKSNV